MLVQVRIHISTRVSTHAYTNVDTPIYAHVRTRVHTHVYALMRTFQHTAHMFILMFIGMSTQRFV